MSLVHDTVAVNTYRDLLRSTPQEGSWVFDSALYYFMYVDVAVARNYRTYLTRVRFNMLGEPMARIAVVRYNLKQMKKPRILPRLPD